MLKRFVAWLYNLIVSTPVHLAIVRRYTDANGAYVGELYLYGTQGGIGSYRCVGASLDSLPLNLGICSQVNDHLDLAHDFLAPLPPNTIRVGALVPSANDAVREMIRKLSRRNIKLVIQNRFI